MSKQEEQQPLLKELHPTATLEIDNGLSLVPRVKLNLTIYPSTPLTLTNPIDEWKMKRALLDFLHSSSHSLTLAEEDLNIKRLKDLKKRKRDDPVAAGTLRIWDLTSIQMEDEFIEWRKQLVEKMNGIELNLEGLKFRLAVDVPVSDDFQAMKKTWQEFYAFQNRGFSRVRREPDTIILRGVPSRWFAEPRVSSKPSMLVTHTIFSTFGKIRNLNVAEDDDLGKDANEDSGDLVRGLYCKVVVQFEKYKDFEDALRVLCSRSLQKICITFMDDIIDENWVAIDMNNTLQNLKLVYAYAYEQQGSRLKADYEVSWDKDGFFWNSRNQIQEKDNKVSSAVAADHYRSDAPRRHAYSSRHSPDNVRQRRFKE